MSDQPTEEWKPQLSEEVRQLLREQALQRQAEPRANYTVDAADNPREHADRALSAFHILFGVCSILTGSYFIAIAVKRDWGTSAMYSDALLGVAAILHGSLCLALSRGLWSSAFWARRTALGLAIAWLLGLLYYGAFGSIWFMGFVPVALTVLSINVKGKVRGMEETYQYRRP